MPTCKKPVPTNKKLYESIKSDVKSKVNRWPSAYASGQLVQQYKRQGGKYRCERSNLFGSLTRWFKEKWVDVCTGKPCGRKDKERRGYPYCRPSKRVNSQTPTTVQQLSASQRKKRCATKHRIKKKVIKS